MAKRKKNKRSRKLARKFLFLVLVVAAGVMCYLVWDAYFRDKAPKEPSQSEVVSPENTTPQSDDVSQDAPDPSTEDVSQLEVKQYEGADPNSGASLTGSITSAFISGGTLRIRVNIDQFLSSGQCAITLQQDGTIVHESAANLIATVSTSTCEGFDIPAATLPAGPIDISISFTSGGKSGTATGKVDI